MKVNKRFIFESVIFTGIIYLIVFGWIIVEGYILTANYVPDIIKSYASVDYLDSKVAMGYAYKYDWATIIIGFLVLSGIYYGIRILLNHLIKEEVKIKFEITRRSDRYQITTYSLCGANAPWFARCTPRDLEEAESGRHIDSPKISAI